MRNFESPLKINHHIKIEDTIKEGKIRFCWVWTPRILGLIICGYVGGMICIYVGMILYIITEQKTYVGIYAW